MSKGGSPAFAHLPDALFWEGFRRMWHHTDLVSAVAPASLGLIPQPVSMSGRNVSAWGLAVKGHCGPGVQPYRTGSPISKSLPPHPSQIPADCRGDAWLMRQSRVPAQAERTCPSSSVDTLRLPTSVQVRQTVR